MKNKIVNNFPAKLGEYQYSGLLESSTIGPAYHFGIYKNKKSNELICKLWTGTVPSIHYFELVNEINVYDAFNKISKKDKRQLSELFPSINVPKMYFHSVKRNKVYLAIQKLEGTLLSKEAPEKALEIYQKIIQFFEYLNQIDNFSYSKIQNKGAIEFFVLFHLYLLKLIIIDFKIATKFIKQAPNFYKGLIHIYKNKDVTFVHRDLGGYNNILINKNSVGIIDFQISALTNKNVELANIVSTKSKDKKFIKAFFNSSFFNNFKKNKENLLIFKSLVIYGSTVTSSGGSRETMSASLDLIKKIEKI